MRVRALTFGGTGAGGDIATAMLPAIPPAEKKGIHAGTINLLLECGVALRTCKRSQTLGRRVNDKEHFLDPVTLYREDDPNTAIPGYALRGKGHRSEFDNVVEVVTTWVPGLGNKQHFYVEGPFVGLPAPQSLGATSQEPSSEGEEQ